MGQSHSRSTASSTDARPAERPSDTPIPSIPETSTIPDSTLRRRSQRYSSHFSFLQRSAQEPDFEAPADGDYPTTTTTNTSSTRRRSRLSRAGSSFTNTIPSIFVRNASTSVSRDRRSLLPPPPPYRGLRRTNPSINMTSASSAPQLQMPDLHIPLDLTSTFQNSQNRLRADYDLEEDEHGSSSLADRISSLTPDRGFRDRTLRNRTQPLGRRRSPSGRPEGQEAMLSRLLSVVAAATAATLMGGNAENAISDFHSTTGDVDGDDGTFNGFLQALRNGRFTSALGQQPGEPVSGENGQDSLEGPLPLEFFRMFRFGSSNTTRRRHVDSSRPSSRHSSPDGPRTDEGATEHRMVPILIVGIRALNGESEGTQDNGEGMPPFLEALTSRPANFSVNLSETPDGLLPQPIDDGSINQRRRATYGNLFSSGRDAFRSARSSVSSRARSVSRPPPPSTSASDSPHGPYAPPSTPASPPLSAVSSGTSTPTGRSAYSSTAAQLGVSPRRDSFIRRMTGTTLEPTAEESSPPSTASSSSIPTSSRPPRHRRVSDSDTPRFGSGSSRRNGVLVEPPEGDGPQTGEGGNSAGANRSWIIYILGGSYPENHPILSTPSLFTDSPTYEDMLLLSSLLGPAKPPVANAADVAAAPGLLRIRVIDGGAVVTAVVVGEGGDDGEATVLASGERCLVCLCDYEDGEEARRLIKCGHLFHRECIDQWLTTGRNSCPLCRGQGVDEKAGDGADNGGVVGDEGAASASAAARAAA